MASSTIRFNFIWNGSLFALFDARFAIGLYLGLVAVVTPNVQHW